VLVIYSPKIGVDADAVAKAMAGFQPPWASRCWPAGWATPAWAKARRILNERAIPSFRTPEAAVGAFGNIASFLPEPAAAAADAAAAVRLAKPDIEGARLLIESVLAERRKVLTEMESKALLAAFHIPVTQDHAGAQRQRGDADRHAAGLSGGAEDRLARHQPQVRRAGRGAQRHERHQVRDTYNDMLQAVRACSPARASTA
jgi:acetyltransferase